MPTPARPTPAPIPSAPRRARSLRAFLRPYRGTLTLASGPTLVETLLDLARPWPLKLAVDNAIGGQPLDGPSWATPRLGAWQASTIARPPLAPRPA